MAYGEEEYNFEVNPDYPVLGLLRRVFAAQRTWARPYVVFGRMAKPPRLDVAHVEADGFRGEPWEVRIPTVFHAAWTAQDGTRGVVCCNWSGSDQPATLWLTKPAGSVAIVSDAGRRVVDPGEVADGRLRLTVPARSPLLVEQR